MPKALLLRLKRPTFESRCAVLAFVLMLICGFAAADDRIDDLMYQDPAFPDASTYAEFSDELKPLWLQALTRPESELQRLAADTIALAHRTGMKGLEDTADKLIAIFEQNELDPTVRNAVARALVTLESNQAAEAFGKSMKSATLELATIIEPALANWDYEPAREIWRQRLEEPANERARRLLAINCLRTVKDEDALADILNLVTDANGEIPTRIAAARAAANINDVELLNAANGLMASEADQPTANMLAAMLMASQSGPKAVSILKRLATNDSVVVSGLALRRLFEIGPANVYEFAETSIRSKDVNVRRVGCEALVHQADAEAIRLLATVLNDSNPGLRKLVSGSLIQLAQRLTLQDAVIQASVNIVKKDGGWRELEQAIIVLGTLDHEPIAMRFFQLLDHRRPDVAVAASWGIRKLAIVELLPEMFDQAERRVKSFRSRPIEPHLQIVLDAQLSQLFQAFGEMDYSEPEAIMRTFIPKNTADPARSRAAAVWALGKLKAGKLDEPLAKQLARRLSDISPSDPELMPVRRMSAIALGRMDAKSQLSVLRRFADEAPMKSGQASAWSLKRMTGEVHEFSLERPVRSSEWFLRPR